MSQVNSNLPPVVGAAPRASSSIAPPRSLSNPALEPNQPAPPIQMYSNGRLTRAGMEQVIRPVAAGGRGGSVLYKGPNDTDHRIISTIEGLPSAAELALTSGSVDDINAEIEKHQASIKASAAAVVALTASAKSVVAAPIAAVPAGPTAEEFAALKKQLDDANAEKEQARQELSKIEEELAATLIPNNNTAVDPKPVAAVDSKAKSAK